MARRKGSGPRSQSRQGQRADATPESTVPPESPAQRTAQPSSNVPDENDSLDESGFHENWERADSRRSGDLQDHTRPSLESAVIAALKESNEALRDQNVRVNKALDKKWATPSTAIILVLGICSVLSGINVYSGVTASSSLEQRADDLKEQIKESKAATQSARDATIATNKELEKLREDFEKQQRLTARAATTANDALASINIGHRHLVDGNDGTRALAYAVRAEKSLLDAQSELADEGYLELRSSLDKILLAATVLRIEAALQQRDIDAVENGAQSLLDRNCDCAEGYHYLGVSLLHRVAEEADESARKQVSERASESFKAAIAEESEASQLGNSAYFYLTLAGIDSGKYLSASEYALRFVKSNVTTNSLDDFSSREKSYALWGESLRILAIALAGEHVEPIDPSDQCHIVARDLRPLDLRLLASVLTHLVSRLEAGTDDPDMPTPALAFARRLRSFAASYTCYSADEPTPADGGFEGSTDAGSVPPPPADTGRD